MLAVLCRGMSGPHDAGNYNSSSWDTAFFVSQGGSWNGAYGHFFLSWYSGLLVRHADRILTAAAEVMNAHGRPRIFRAVKEVRGGRSLGPEAGRAGGGSAEGGC